MASRVGRSGTHVAIIVAALLFLDSTDVPARFGLAVQLFAQVPFAQIAPDLESPDPAVRLRATRLLRDAAGPEAAVPLARVVADRQPEIQLEAIAAELNIFRADKIAPRSRLGALVPGRAPISAEATFSAGPLVVGPRAVPSEVLTALRDAALSTNVRVALEALYAFGALSSEPGGIRRREMLRTSGPDLVALLSARETAIHGAAIQVIGRAFAWRPRDGAPDVMSGDAIVAELNDKDRSTRGLAMQALGSMRYERSVLALTSLFDSYGKGDLAEIALAALARIAHPSSAGLFLTQLKSGDPAQRVAAVEGLARIGNTGNLPAIEAAVAAERNPQVVLASYFASTLLSNRPIDRIAEALGRPALRGQAQQYLVTLAAERPGTFSPYLQDPDPRMRADMLDALALGRDPSALPFATTLLRDPDPQVAFAAERAVARLQ